MSDKPWMTQAAIDELESKLQPHHSVLEFGAGGSTVWLAQRVSHVFSIEHSSKWARAVETRLARLGLNNVTLIIECDPDCYSTAGPTSPYLFDIALIDGKHRCECIRRAAPRIKPGGTLVLDDSERRAYEPGITYVNCWERLDITGLKEGSHRGQIVSTQTSFFRKPR